MRDKIKGYFDNKNNIITSLKKYYKIINNTTIPWSVEFYKNDIF